MSEISELAIQSGNGEYVVKVGPSSLQAMLASKPNAAVIADARFLKLPELADHTVIGVVADEHHKTLIEVERLAIELRCAGVGRSGHLIAIGGGVVQDVATLLAQTYMRGLNWTYSPTTLLGMVDSCIGGKSSINAGDFKNLVGSIYPPEMIAIDPAFLQTLPGHAIAGGLAEAAKISYCRSPEAFNEYVSMRGRFAQAPSDLIVHSLEAKRWFIEVDEFDVGPRRLLNFGHTFGHALEAATGFAVDHGIGVALGMLAAERFGVETGFGVADPGLAAEAWPLAADGENLNNAIDQFDSRIFRRSFAADKKHGPDGYHLILPSQPGPVAEVVVDRDDAMLDIAERVTLEALAGAIS